MGVIDACNKSIVHFRANYPSKTLYRDRRMRDAGLCCIGGRIGRTTCTLEGIDDCRTLIFREIVR
jgi:hypothetical protein